MGKQSSTKPTNANAFAWSRCLVLSFVAAKRSILMSCRQMFAFLQWTGDQHRCTANNTFHKNNHFKAPRRLQTESHIPQNACMDSQLIADKICWEPSIFSSKYQIPFCSNTLLKLISKYESLFLQLLKNRSWGGGLSRGLSTQKNWEPRHLVM